MSERSLGSVVVTIKAVEEVSGFVLVDNKRTTESSGESGDADDNAVPASKWDLGQCSKPLRCKSRCSGLFD